MCGQAAGGAPQSRFGTAVSVPPTPSPLFEPLPLYDVGL